MYNRLIMSRPLQLFMTCNFVFIEKKKNQKISKKGYKTLKGTNTFASIYKKTNICYVHKLVKIIKNILWTFFYDSSNSICFKAYEIQYFYARNWIKMEMIAKVIIYMFCIQKTKQNKIGNLNNKTGVLSKRLTCWKENTANLL